MKQNRVVMFVDAPVKGKVFKKLIREVGEEGALEAYRDAVNHIRDELSGDDRWSFSFAVSPDREAHNPLWGTTTAFGTGKGDRGRKMINILINLVPGNVMIIDAHCPFVTKDDMVAGFDALQTNDIVFGPNNAGGFWGVGLKRDPLPLDPFKNVDWRGKDILKTTMSNLRHDRGVKMLRELRTIESAGALEDFRAQVSTPAT